MIRQDKWAEKINMLTLYVQNQFEETQKYIWLPILIVNHNRTLGAVSIRKTVLPGMAIPMLKIRRPNGRLIFNMEIAIRR